ncbi:MAG: aromatic ring-hydroxylating dioxygenase subunit alpha [Crocinitomicaceae bacterium]
MIKNQWYLAALLPELKKQNPLPKKIIGKELVIFKTESGAIHVLEDRCCHRNVNLSLGYVKGEHLKCAYHGWEFQGNGKCGCIPSLPREQEIPNTVKIATYPTVQKHNCIWVWMGEVEKMDQSKIPPMDELDEYPFVYNYHDIKGDLQLIAESLIDAYHINHVHRNSIKGMMGNLHGEEIAFNLNVDEASLTGEYYRHNEGSIFEKFYFGFEKKILTKFGFWFPHSSKLDIHFKKRRLVIYEHFYQIDENTVRMCQITAWKKIFNGFPLFFFAKWFMLNKSIRIVQEDIAILESNKKIKDKRPSHDLLITPSDEVSLEFIKLWKKNTQPYEKATEKEDRKEAQVL